MFQSITRLSVCALLLVLAGSSYYLYRQQSAGLQIQRLVAEKQQLQAFVDRLSDERRVADVIVTDQKEVDGVLQTTLLFVEYARDGSALPGKSFTVAGNTAHVDAMVIKFDRGYLETDDALRGHSVALFCRLYGDGQTPGNAFRIDEPGQIPDVYRGPGAADAQAFEKDLWANFWRLADDKSFRESKGVRVADGEGVWGPFLPDRLYTLTLASSGGLSLTSEPLKGIYKEALRRK